MDLKIWMKASFEEDNIPDWVCPNCDKGILKKDKFASKETAESAICHDEEGWEPEFIRYTFTGSLICPSCNEFVAFLGDGSEEFFYGFDQISRMEYQRNYSSFEPKYFFPPLKIFQIHKKCPTPITNVIEESFSHFWADLSACANKIRVSLELLLNDLNVPLTDEAGKMGLSTHRRIIEFKKVNPEVADYLLAIKWIGNVGSHIGKLEKIDILETYEILEFCLDKLYDDTEAKLKKVTAEINKNKGVRKRNFRKS